MEEKIVNNYKEELTYSKEGEHLWSFSCALRSLNKDLQDIESTYFIDKKDKFWFEADFLELILKINKEKDRIKNNNFPRYIDVEKDKRIFLFDFDLKRTLGKLPVKEYNQIVKIILSNKRWGAPRKNYICENGKKINISKESKYDEEDPNQVNLLDTINKEK